MTERLASLASLTSPALVYLLARASSVRLTTEFSERGMADLLPRHALQLFPLLLGGGLRASDLATRLGVSRQAIAQVVGTLERAGYVTRIGDPGDRRAKLVCLTARGRTASRVLRNSMQELGDDWERTLGPQRMTAFRDSLTILVNKQD
jgi:DNA-binding MarR family transcriptional regulator